MTAGGYVCILVASEADVAAACCWREVGVSNLCLYGGEAAAGGTCSDGGGGGGT